MADIPGLIEGAHLGHGLGIQFLRHVERTRLLVHLVDLSDATGRDPVEDFDVVMTELASFSQELVNKPMFVVGTKLDAAQDAERRASLERLAARTRPPLLRHLQRHRRRHRGFAIRHGRTAAEPPAGVSRTLSRRSSLRTPGAAPVEASGCFSPG